MRRMMPMYDKICPVCGSAFQSPNPCYKYCSDPCRKTVSDKRKREYSRIYYQKTLDAQRAYRKKHYKHVGRCCEDCGALLPDGRQRYCLDCLLKDYIENKSRIAYARLACRGYDRELIALELQSRR